MSDFSKERRALLAGYFRGRTLQSTIKETTIPRRHRSGPLPLSYSQQQIFLHSQLAGESLIYNEPVTIHRYGELDRSALERSFLEIARRHEAWRTTFHWNGDEPVQIVHPPPSYIKMPFVDLRQYLEPDREREAIRLATEDALQPFDLTKGPLYRPRLVQLHEGEHRLFLTLHHIIFDGVSLYRVFLAELQNLYEASANNVIPKLNELPIQYPDYAVWQRGWVEKRLPEELSYWKTILKDLPVLELKTDHPRSNIQTYAGATEMLQLSPSLSTALKALGEKYGATPFMTMVASFIALLHGYSGQEDIAIGGVSNGRHHTETENLLGCFLNTIVIRCSFSKDWSFAELLTRVRSVTLEALSHDSIPFELLVQRFAAQRSPGRAPLVQVLIVVEPPLPPLKPGWAFTHMDVDTQTAKFNLQLGLDDRPEGLTGRFIYNRDLFEGETITLLKSRWLKLLSRIAVSPTERICNLRTEVWRETEYGLKQPVSENDSHALLLGRDEREKLLVEWNKTRTNYPREATIQQVFEEQTRRAPSALAVVFQDARLSYDELNRRANKLARRLRNFGIGRGLPVGIYMARSWEMIAAMLAVLKAGGAYVPLDPSYPAERLAWMIDDTEMPVILTQTDLRASSAIANKLGRTTRLVCVDRESLTTEEESNLAQPISAEDLAYMMYTSGSTGIPKGVAITHRGVVRLVKETNYASFSSEETFLQLAAISFDASTFEIWGPLLNGSKLVVMPPARPSLEEIGNAIRDYGVTTLWLTAGLFNAMIDERLHDLRTLRQLLTGGDVLSVEHVGKALRELKNTRLINGYGPTETTTFACCHLIEAKAALGKSIPIGKPIANTTAYILDANLQLVPIGASGQLFIGGDGLARGYWRREDWTAEKFIDDPFSAEPGARLYQTGDLARWRSDGVIEFLGRMDNQIKLRGYRIEPGEIESALRRQPEVLDAAVVLREDKPGDKQLVAYVVRKTDTPVPLEESAPMAALKKSLPDYMVPNAIVFLDALPRTLNDKLDRRALPPLDFSVPEQTFVAPKSSLEEKLAEIWAAVLGVERVGRLDNFFHLGGHSLAALRLVNQLRESLGEDVSLTIVFEAPSLAGMATLLEKNYGTGIARWTHPTGGNASDLATRQAVISVPAVDRESRRAGRA